MLKLKQNHITKIFEKSIEFIIKQQLSDGSFVSLSSGEVDNFSNPITYHTNFINAIILEAFSYLPEMPQLYDVKKNLSSFLLSQKSEHWSWNYWSKLSKEFTSMPYPDDLDDTFCALNALFLFDKKFITGSTIAHIVQVLTRTEEKEGGPYKTWLVSPDKSGWDDVDLFVNSNVAYFLFLQETTLPNLQFFFEKRLREKEVKSKYYPSIYPFFYSLSRFYTDKKSIENMLLANRNKQGYWENPLYTALAILALLNTDFPPQELEKSIVYLLAQQKKDQWQAYAFCIDPAQKGRTYYSGSPVLTTIFCLAAASLFMKRIEGITSHKKNSERGVYVKKIINSKMLQFDEKEFTELGDILVNKIMSKDTTKQIPLMPYYFTQTLGKYGKMIQKKDIILLGQANVLGWLAYTIYDDFLDDEGKPVFLPLANIYLRRLIQIFDTAFIENNAVAPFFHKMLDTIESANGWEVTRCRFSVQKGTIDLKGKKLPRYGNLEQLAQKSLGHGLGPLTMLLLLGYKEESKEFVSLYRFFIHYLIAKQLHDDAHDWEEDLSKGHISFAVALLLEKADKEKIITTKKIEIKKVIPKFQRLFWYEIIEVICSQIYSHITMAQQELDTSPIIVNKKIFEDLLKIYQDGADKALEERKKTIEFLEVYS